MSVLILILVFLALVLGILALFNVATRFSLVAAAVVCLALVELLPRLAT